MAAQAAQGKRAESLRVEAAEAVEALEDRGGNQLSVTEAQAFNRPYLVPPIIMAAAAAAAATTSLAMEDWAEVDRVHLIKAALRVLLSRGGAGVVALKAPGDQAAPASSSSATRRKPPSRRR